MAEMINQPKAMGKKAKHYQLKIMNKRLKQLAKSIE